MDKAIRNTLRSTVTRCRRLLEDAIKQVLEGRYGIYTSGKLDDAGQMEHLSDEERDYRKQVLVHLEHIQAAGFAPADAVGQLVREVAFTHLNRLCAYKLMETRKLIREAVSRGIKSNGFLFYLADHDADERRYTGGQQEIAYRNFLLWLGSTLSDEIGTLFSPHDPANRLFPPQKVLDQVLDLINSDDLAAIWTEDETIGWVYQYFTPKELRDQARKASAAPRNSYELAFRNQFYTPRYVVQFLVDNTLGRIWYEMMQGGTRLTGQCAYLVRGPDEVFLSQEMPTAPAGYASNGCVAEATLLWEGTEETYPPYSMDDADVQRLVYLAHCVNGYQRHGAMISQGERWELYARIKYARDLSAFSTQDLLDVLFAKARADHHGGWTTEPEFYVRIGSEVRRRVLYSRRAALSQPEQLQPPVFIPYRAKQDPRSLKILDPAGGSGHFLLYCFDLLEQIYVEAWEDEQPAAWRVSGKTLRQEYATPDDLRRAIPGLILRHNLHGIDIDLRATQIAALALWLRAQRAYQEQGIQADRRPPITRVNIVCAEPMPGNRAMLQEFLRGVDARLHSLVLDVWDKMKLAGEVGSLLTIEEEIDAAIKAARVEHMIDAPPHQITLFEQDQPPVQYVMNFATPEEREFWNHAEDALLRALELYARQAAGTTALQRRLFADDAERGFGFVDMCRRRFDLVLMNPPFGAASTPSKAYIEQRYPRTKNDVYAAFVERGVDLLRVDGMLGAITSRTGFFLSSFQKWREEIVLPTAPPVVFADLGYGVLDTAMVETAAYCLRKQC